MKMFAHVQELEVPRAEGLGKKEHTASAWSWRGKALMIEAGLQAPPVCMWSWSPWCFVPRRLPGPENWVSPAGSGSAFASDALLIWTDFSHLARAADPVGVCSSPQAAGPLLRNTKQSWNTTFPVLMLLICQCILQARFHLLQSNPFFGI